MRAAAEEAVRCAGGRGPEEARGDGRRWRRALHISMASEAGEYAMRDVVRHAVEAVRS